MSWEQELFAVLEDLEGQATALYAAERAPEVADRSRSEYQAVTLAARLVASLDRDVTVDLAGVGAVSGRLERVATGWSLVRGQGQDWIVRHGAITAVHGASDRAVPELAWPVVARLGLTAALRRLAQEAEPCTIRLTDGRSHDGTVTRVGADFAEVAVGEPGRLVLVPFAHLAAAQSRDDR